MKKIVNDSNEEKVISVPPKSVTIIITAEDRVTFSTGRDGFADHLTFTLDDLPVQGRVQFYETNGHLNARKGEKLPESRVETVEI